MSRTRISDCVPVSPNAEWNLLQFFDSVMLTDNNSDMLSKADRDLDRILRSNAEIAHTQQLITASLNSQLTELSSLREALVTLGITREQHQQRVTSLERTCLVLVESQRRSTEMQTTQAASLASIEDHLRTLAQSMVAQAEPSQHAAQAELNYVTIASTSIRSTARRCHRVIRELMSSLQS